MRKVVLMEEEEEEEEQDHQLHDAWLLLLWLKKRGQESTFGFCLC